jgi:hypothetical protein
MKQIVRPSKIAWVIRYCRKRDRRIEIAGFGILELPGLKLNADIISLSMRYFGVDHLWAKCADAVATFLWNILARRQFLFLHK